MAKQGKEISHGSEPLDGVLGHKPATPATDCCGHMKYYYYEDEALEDDTQELRQ